MRKRVYLVLAVPLIAVMGLAIIVGLRAQEPVYQGKRLTYWLEGEECTNEETEQAVLHIGTNCIPTLLRKLQARDSALKRKFLELADEQDVITIKSNTAEDERDQAVRGFRFLGERAGGAVHVLTNLYSRSPPDLQESIAEALGVLGKTAKGAVPALLWGMTSTNDRVRLSAGSALGEISSDPTLVVPVMIKALRDPSESIRESAVGCLEHFGTNARSAIPALVATAQDKSASVRCRVMYALRVIGGEPHVIVPLLISALSDSDAAVKDGAAYALGAFGTNAESAIPLLVKLAAEEEANPTQFTLLSGFRAVAMTKGTAVYALGEIHLQPQITIPALLKALSDPSSRVRAYAAQGLGNFGTNAIQAVPPLLQLYFDEQKRPPRKQIDYWWQNPLEVVSRSLVRIDPAAAAKAGINTNGSGANVSQGGLPASPH